ncbi:uncharacterized protein HMPREF1541_02945 [Cyphellophora europaea CBS 101466]|uniref:Uncharacterized protein n=1 Tax=Cyphellophora europaea (strain CBS 101466) TaxID=1220924 RepID=W2RX50_CYPE1|nr:uncharacterized protein HMPREF1541_02945 [Cyphellophora europaea CBS 101466]ETN41012.1 hypothetical protein HMPREF1541_02945 [Cyphellophora europaea CBS 101466]
MATTLSNTNIRTNDAGYSSGSDDGQAAGGRKSLAAYQQNGQQPSQPFAKPPSSDNLGQAAGSLLKGATDDDGKLKNAGLMVGIKLDLEAEVHLTARVRGDIVIGLY